MWVKKNREYLAVAQSGSYPISITEVRDEDDVDAERFVVNDVYKVKINRDVDISVGSKIIDRKFAESIQTVNKATAIIGVYTESSKCITVGYTGVMHMNGLCVNAKVTGIFDLKKQKLKVARRGEKSLFKLEIVEGLVVDRRKRENFCLRDEDVTVGVGAIIK